MKAKCYLNSQRSKFFHTKTTNNKFIWTALVVVQVILRQSLLRHRSSLRDWKHHTSLCPFQALSISGSLYLDKKHLNPAIRVWYFQVWVTTRHHMHTCQVFWVQIFPFNHQSCGTLKFLNLPGQRTQCLENLCIHKNQIEEQGYKTITLLILWRIIFFIQTSIKLISFSFYNKKKFISK